LPHTVRVVRMRGRPRIATRAVPFAVAIGLAWVLELWLLVLGCAAGAITFIRRRRWYRRAVLPAVVAGSAAAGPSGVTPSAAVEEYAALWLAVVAEGRPQWLRNAARLLAEADGDPWTVYVATSRLELADVRLSEGKILGLPPRRGRVPIGWRAAIWMALAVGFLGVAHLRGTWWLVPTAWAFGGAMFGLMELEQSRAAPRLLTMEALAVPYRWEDLATTALELALLARGDGDVLRRARRLVEAAAWDIPNRQTALRKLTAAEAMTGDADLGLLAAFDEGHQR
jgi:hypothetical protein